MKQGSTSNSQRTDSPSSPEMYLPAMPQFLPAPGRIEQMMENLLGRLGPRRLALKHAEK